MAPGARVADSNSSSDSRLKTSSSSRQHMMIAIKYKALKDVIQVRGLLSISNNNLAFNIAVNIVIADAGAT